MENNLILKDSCYVQNTCKKYKNKDCQELFCVRLFKIDELFNQSLLSKEQRKHLKLRLDNNRIDEQAYSQLKQYQLNIVDFVDKGSNLYIYSKTTGNGKTSWAIKLLQAYIYNIWAKSNLECKALFINIPKFMRELKLHISHESEYINHINKYILKADMVIWDDVATKVASEYEGEQLISIIDSRVNDNKCNIFTSNIEPHQLHNFVGVRLASRIIGLSTIVKFEGSDKRGVNIE